MLKAIKERHSVRSFYEEKVSDNKIEEIVEAGRLAPSALGKNLCRILIIEDKEVLTELRIAIRNVANRGSAYVFDYLAPTLVVVISPKDNYFAYQDGACIMMNMMLEAVNQKVGSCWINQVNKFRDDARVKEILRLSDDEFPVASLAIGIPKEDRQAFKNKTGNSISYIK